MRHRRLLVAALAAAASSSIPAGPAQAVGAAVGGSGAIDVYPDMGACATVRFAQPTAFAGSFSAAGALAGPGTIVGAVRGALPIVVADGTEWFGCLPDAYAGAAAGQAVYTLHASAPTGDVVVSKSCTVTSGSMRCV